MAKYTFTTAFVKAQALRKELLEAEDNYIYIIEKILRRELFRDGKLVEKPDLCSLSKMELQIYFNKLQKAFIKYEVMAQLVHKLQKEYVENDKTYKR